MPWPDSGGRDEVRLHPGGPGESAPRGEPEGEREKDQAARCLSPWGQGCGRSAGAGGGNAHCPDLSDSTYKAQKTGGVLV